MINFKTECEGWFSLSAFKVDDNGVEIPGSRREPVPPFKNLILNQGLNRMGDNPDWLTWCQVGSGSTAPSVNDTSLVSRVAGSLTLQSGQSIAQPSPPYYVARTNTYRFAAGVATGNLAEVGVGWASTGSLFSRALVLDALGNPTTITVLSDEILDVTYQFRQYMPAVDGAGSVTLRGVVHSFVSRACAVTTAATNASNTGWFLQASGTSAGATGGSLDSAYTGGIGSETSTGPSGVNLPATSSSPSPYSSGSLSRDFVLFFNNSSGNNASGIGAIRIRLGIGLYQFGFTPSIMKTANDTLSLTFRHSWARKTL